MDVLSFEGAVSEWIRPCGETCLPIFPQTRAFYYPNKIFTVVYWNEHLRTNDYKTFNVGLRCEGGGFVVDKILFNAALSEKIKLVEASNLIGKTQIQIRYTV